MQEYIHLGMRQLKELILNDAEYLYRLGSREHLMFLRAWAIMHDATEALLEERDD